MAKITSTKDIIMLLLYAKGYKGQKNEPIRTRIRMVKMVFLFQKEIRAKFNLEKAIPDSAFPDFQPYDYGPFADQIYADLEFLVNLGFVNPRPSCSDKEAEEDMCEYEYWQVSSGIAGGSDNERNNAVEFSLTNNGLNFVKDGNLGNLTAEQWEGVHTFKCRCLEISLYALLRYVYTKYPKMATNSKIAERIFKKRNV
ncbi:MAG: hypothetical protein GY858_09530 [Candidatus Omnitrophica bacterium]|nr:hypothetical protein [Candidatus Omnitrophota bacterium]